MYYKCKSSCLSCGWRRRYAVCGMLLAVLALVVAGCRTTRGHRQKVDKAAYDLVGGAQEAVLGGREPFRLERSSARLRQRLIEEQVLPEYDADVDDPERVKAQRHWPDDRYFEQGGEDAGLGLERDVGGLVELTLEEALQVAAYNSREFQEQKERVFNAALRLDAAGFDFKSQWSFRSDTTYIVDETVRPIERGVESGSALGVGRTLQNGLSASADVGLDLVKLLTGTMGSTLGLTFDASVSLPLLRGAGRHIVRESLTQGERELVYAMNDFVRFRRGFVIAILGDYLSVLEQWDRIRNAEENIVRARASYERSQKLAESGRLTRIQVDQARQNYLSARESLIRAREAYENSLDQFKLTLGLPADARFGLDPGELDKLAETTRLDVAAEAITDLLGEPLPDLTRDSLIPEQQALELAFGNRLDLLNARGRITDAERAVVIAADSLRAEVTLGGSAGAGEGRSLSSADEANADLDFSEGFYTGLLTVDLPLKRRAERIAYRRSLMDWEASQRDLEELEDGVKLDIRQGLRELARTRESYFIQLESIGLNRLRVESAQLFLEAGRAEIRDLLEAQDDLLDAQNARTSALVDYRVATLALQRDMGVLDVDYRGLWKALDLTPLPNNE